MSRSDVVLDPTHADRLRALVRERIREVPDFPKPGILFRDITTVLAQPDALDAALALHADAIADLVGTVTKVVGVESRGFLFGMALAARIGTGFVLVRKPGKLPRATIEASYALEYGTDRLQMHTDAVAPGESVIVVDDLLATGGTAAAVRELVERVGGTVAAALFLVELRALGGRSKLPGVRVEAVIGFE